jgi:hypothetical protein
MHRNSACSGIENVSWNLQERKKRRMRKKNKLKKMLVTKKLQSPMNKMMLTSQVSLELICGCSMTLNMFALRTVETNLSVWEIMNER